MKNQLCRNIVRKKQEKKEGRREEKKEGERGGSRKQAGIQLAQWKRKFDGENLGVSGFQCVLKAGSYKTYHIYPT